MLRVRDIMSTDVLVLPPELGLREAVETLLAHHVGGAPVVAAGLVLGVVSITDVASLAAWSPGVPTERPEVERDVWDAAREWDEGQETGVQEEAPAAYFTDFWADVAADVTQRFADSATPEWDVLAERVVADVMTGSVCSVGPDAAVTDAARRMIQADVHRLLVLDGRRLLGIVTATDVVRAVADHRLPAKRRRRRKTARAA